MINRIILIGNGFDRAHNMKTTYEDFIDSYWADKLKAYCSSQDDIFTCNEFSISKFSWTNPLLNYNDFRSYTRKNFGSLKVLNSLFFDLSKINTSSWLDIETYYYELLKIHAFNKDDRQYDIKLLNSNFEKVKLLLEKYLSQEVNKVHKTNIRKRIIHDNIYEHLKLKDISEEGLDKIADEVYNQIKRFLGPEMKDTFADSYLTNFEREVLSELQGIEFDRSYLFKYLKEKTLKDEIETTFLSFNYSDTEKFYKTGREEIIHIHGELNNILNPMIFGYGDELDDDYKAIEKLNNNDYLDNIKSTNYAKTDNYKKLLQTINSGLYQVYVLGHSCGNTDRTLLNTIFEHDNCVSIKIFYHQLNENRDNYLDIYKNISRNFNSKSKLRDRVVNKAYSKPLIPFVSK